MKFANRRRQLQIGFYTAIVLSLLLHFGFVTGLLILPHAAPKEDRIEVQIVDQAPTLRK